MVPFVQQGGSNGLTKLILSDNLDRFSAKIQSGPNLPSGSNSPNGQHLSGNVDHQISYLCCSVFVSFKFISVFINQYLDAGKKK